jgi:hypothetical protein
MRRCACIFGGAALAGGDRADAGGHDNQNLIGENDIEMPVLLSEHSAGQGSWRAAASSGPSHHNVVVPQAPIRLALEYGFGRSGARWYVPSSID